MLRGALGVQEDNIKTTEQTSGHVDEKLEPEKLFDNGEDFI